MLIQEPTKSQKLQNNYRAILTRLKRFQQLNFEKGEKLIENLEKALKILEEVLYYTDSQFKVDSKTLTSVAQTLYNKSQSIIDGLDDPYVSFESDLLPLLLTLKVDANNLYIELEGYLGDTIDISPKNNPPKSMTLEEFGAYYNQVKQKNQELNDKIEDLQKSVNNQGGSSLKEKFTTYNKFELPTAKMLGERPYIVVNAPILLMSMSGIRNVDLKKLENIDYINLTPGVIFEEQPLLAVPTATTLKEIDTYIKEIETTHNFIIKRIFPNKPPLQSIRSPLVFYWLTPATLYEVVKDYRLTSIKFGFRESYSKNQQQQINLAKNKQSSASTQLKEGSEEIINDLKAAIKGVEDQIIKQEGVIKNKLTETSFTTDEIVTKHYQQCPALKQLNKELKALRSQLKAAVTKFATQKIKINTDYKNTLKEIKE